METEAPGDPPRREPRPPFGRRIFKWLARALLATLLGFAFLYLTRGFLANPLLLRLAVWGAERAGYALEAERLESDWFSRAALTAPRLRALEEAAPLRSLEGRRVEVTFSLPALLGGGGLEGIEAEGLTAVVDLGRPAQDDESEPFTLPEHLPEVEADLAVELLLGGGARAELSGGILRVARSSSVEGTDEETVRLLLAEARYLPAASGRTAAPVEVAPIEIAPVEIELTYRAGRLAIGKLEAGDLLRARPSTVDLRRLGEGTAAWEVDLEALGGSMRLDGGLEAGELSLALRGEGLRLEALDAALPEASRSGLAGGLSLDGGLRLSLDDPSRAVGAASFRVEGVTLGEPEAGQQRIGDIEGELAAGEGLLTVPRLAVSGPGNALTLTELRLPLAWEGLEAAVERASGRFEAEATALPDLLGSALPAAEIPAHRLRLAGELGEGEVRVTEGSLAVAGSRLRILEAGAELAFTAGDGERVLTPALRLEAELSSPDLGPVGRALGSSDWKGSLAGSVRLAGTWPRLSGAVRLRGQGVTIGGFEAGEVEVEARGDPAEVAVQRLAARASWGWIEGTGSYAWEGGRFGPSAFEAHVADLAVLRGASDLTGALDLTARLEGTLEAPRGRVEASGSGLAWGGQELGGLELLLEHGTGAGAAEGGADSTLVALRLEGPLGRLVADAGAEGLLGAVRGGKSWGATATRLELSRGGVDLALERPATFSLEGPRIALSDAELSGAVGRVLVEASGTRERGEVAATLIDLHPMVFLEELLPAGVEVEGLSAELIGRWGAGDTELEGWGEADRLALPQMGVDGRLDWQGSLAGGRLRLDRLELSGAGAALVDLTADLPLGVFGEELLAPGELRLAGMLRLPALGILTPKEASGVEGSLEASLDLGGSWRRPRGTVKLTGRELAWRPAESPVEGVVAEAGVEQEAVETAGTGRTLPPGSFDATLVFDDGEEGDEAGVAVHGLEADLPGVGHLRADAHAGLETDVAALAEEGLESFDWEEIPLTAQGRLEVPDLGRLRPWAEGVRRLEGALAGTVEASGTLGRPELGGSLTVTGGALRLEEDGPPFDAVEGRFRFAGRSLEVESLTAELGGAPARIEGRVDWEEGGPRFDLLLAGENLLLARSVEARIRADARLTLTGDLDSPRLEGELALRRSALTANVDLPFLGGRTAPTAGRGLQLFTLRDPPFSGLSFDLAVRSAEPFALRNNLADGSLRLDLRLQGTGEVPLPRGVVYLDPTRVKLPSGVVRFDSGTIVFPEADPFDPRLELHGSSRLRGYDVQVQVSGTYERPEVTLSSSPYLANDELLVLVLTGQLPTGRGGRRAAESVVLYLARDVLTRWTSRGWQEDEALLDRLELVRGRDISDRGVETTEATFLLREDFPGEDDTLSLVAEQDVYEDYNFGLRVVFKFEGEEEKER